MLEPVLRNVPDTKVRKFAGAGAAELFPANDDTAGGDGAHAGQHLAEFLLAVAGNAGDAENFACVNVQRHAVQRDIAKIVIGRNVAQAQDRIG